VAHPVHERPEIRACRGSEIVSGVPEIVEVNLAKVSGGKCQAVTSADGSLNRDAFEAMASAMLGYLEQIGMTEAPQAPGIGITPLAIYRLVPQVA
jgi:hypothetical protein